MVQALFDEELWDRFEKKIREGKSYIKTYPQLDPYFDFSEDSDSIKNLVLDPSLKSISEFSFLPFVKILTKTPRYKYQENLKRYDLETKIRPIAFAAHFDSYIYSFYSFALSEKYQNYIKSNGFGECVLAYRSDLDGKSNIQFAKEVFDVVKHRLMEDGVCAAIALDITGYFDNIDHNILKEKWARINNTNTLPIDQYKVFRSLTKYSYINKDSILKHFNINLKQVKNSWQSLLDLIPNEIAGESFKEKMDLIRRRKLISTNLPKKLLTGSFENRGIPQGSPMSAVLSNIYLMDFDLKMHQLGLKENFKYRRYCDDLIVICHPDQVEDLNKIIKDEIEIYRLKIQEKKTDIIVFKKTLKGGVRGFNKKKILKDDLIINHQNEQKYFKNLQYLGFEFNGTNIYIRSGSLSKYFKKMKAPIVKTIVMSYSDASKRDEILKKQILERYSHFGKQNFLSYAMKASKNKYYSKSGKVFREGMNSLSIRRQISAHFAILEQEIMNKSHSRFEYKEYIYKRKINKGTRAKRKNLKK